jgi:hypothetical protein
MRATKRKKLEQHGWKVGSADEFLDLTPDETASSVEVVAGIGRIAEGTCESYLYDCSGRIRSLIRRQTSLGALDRVVCGILFRDGRVRRRPRMPEPGARILVH